MARVFVIYPYSEINDNLVLDALKSQGINYQYFREGDKSVLSMEGNVRDIKEIGIKITEILKIEKDLEGLIDKSPFD